MNGAQPVAAALEVRGQRRRQRAGLVCLPVGHALGHRAVQARPLGGLEAAVGGVAVQRTTPPGDAGTIRPIPDIFDT
jgi:hypothetical protein